MKKLKYRIIQYKNDNGDTFYRAKYLALGFLWFYVENSFNPYEKVQCKTKEDSTGGFYINRGILYHISEHAKSRRVKNYQIVTIEDIEV